MTKWIELREKIRKIYGKHNRLILAVVKFILALFLFLLINHYVGYMEKLHHVYEILPEHLRRTCRFSCIRQ